MLLYICLYYHVINIYYIIILSSVICNIISCLAKTGNGPSKSCLYPTDCSLGAFVRNISIRMFYGLERSRSFSSSRMIFSAKQSRPPLRPKNLPNWSHGKRNTLCPAPMRTSSCLRCQGLPADFDRRLPFATENLIVIETNIDDMSPQVLAFAMEELLAAGGLDVWAAPVLMKKNRSGTTLGVLCDAGHAKALTELIFRVRRSSLLDIHQ